MTDVILECEEFMYIRAKFTRNGKHENQIMEMIVKGLSPISMILGILWDKEFKHNINKYL